MRPDGPGRAAGRRATAGRLTIYLASNYLIFSLLGYVGSGVTPVAAWQWYLPAAGLAVLGGCALWRLRRQAVL